MLIAIDMRMNYLETGTVYMARSDAEQHNLHFPADAVPYTMLEKHKRPVEIRELTMDQVMLMDRLRQAKTLLRK